MSAIVLLTERVCQFLQLRRDRCFAAVFGEAAGAKAVEKVVEALLRELWWNWLNAQSLEAKGRREGSIHSK